MSQIQITGVSDKEKELIEQAADNAGMPTAQFCRTRMRAGFRLWDLADGSFDTYEMQKRLEQEPTKPTPDNPEPVEASKRDRYAGSIKKNLPQEGSDTTAVSKDELMDLVADDVINDVLDELMDAGEIEYDVKEEGFKRVV